METLQKIEKAEAPAFALKPVRHGLRAVAMMLPGENRRDFNQLCNDLESEWQPRRTPAEHFWVEQMAISRSGSSNACKSSSGKPWTRNRTPYRRSRFASARTPARNRTCSVSKRTARIRLPDRPTLWCLQIPNRLQAPRSSTPADADPWPHPQNAQAPSALGALL